MIEKAPREIEVSDFNFIAISQVNVLSNEGETISSKAPVQLVAASSKYGLVFLGYDQGIKVYKFDDIFPNDNEAVPTPIRVTSLPSPPTVVALSADNLSLAVGQQKDGFPCADVFDTRAFLNKERPPSPFISVRLSSSPNVHTRELVWNPVQAQMFAACLSDGFLGVYEVQDNALQIVATLPSQAGVTAISWSPKGKQLVAGKQSGITTQYKPENLQEVKSFPPPKLEKPLYVTSITWISTTQFAVGYAIKSQPVSYLMIVNVQKGGGATFVQYHDPCCSSGEEREARYIIQHLSEWSLLLCACTNSLEIAVLGASQENKSLWVQWLLESTGRAELPLVKKEETFPMGMAVLTCAQKPIVISETESYNPMPILLLYSTSGTLCSFHIVYARDGIPTVVAPAQTLTLNGERKPMIHKNLPAYSSVPNVIKPESLGGSIQNKTSFPASSNAQSPFGQPQNKNVTFNLEGDGASTQGLTSSFTLPKSTNLSKPISSASPAFIPSTQPSSFIQAPQQPPQITQSISLSSSAASTLLSPVTIQPGLDHQLGKLGVGSTTFIKPMASKPLSPILEQETTTPTNETLQNETCIKAIQDEMKEFEDDIQKLRQSISSTHYNMGSSEELTRLNKEAETMSNFMDEMKITMESLASDIHNLRTTSLERFAAIHEARGTESRSQDENYINLVRSRALDPVAARRLREIKSTYFYLTSQLREAHARLDQEWSAFLDRAKIKRETKQTTVDTIYRTLVTHQNLVFNLSQQLQSLTDSMKSLKISVPSAAKAWAPPLTLNELTKTDTELSSLADSLLQVSVSVSPPKPKPKKLSSDLQLRLADFLSHRNVSYIKPSEIRSASESKLISTIHAQSFARAQTSPSEDSFERASLSDSFKPVPKETFPLVRQQQQPVLSVVTMPTSLPSRGITSGIPLAGRPQIVPKIVAHPEPTANLFGRPPVNESTPKATSTAFRTPDLATSKPVAIGSYASPPLSEFKPVYESITPPSTPIKPEAGTIVMEIKDGVLVKSEIPTTSVTSLSQMGFNFKLAPNAVVASPFSVVNNKQTKEKITNRLPPSTAASTSKPGVSSTFMFGKPTSLSTPPPFNVEIETASFGKSPSAFSAPDAHTPPPFTFTPAQPANQTLQSPPKVNTSFPGVGQVVGSKVSLESAILSPSPTINSSTSNAAVKAGIFEKPVFSGFATQSQTISASAAPNIAGASSITTLPLSLRPFSVLSSSTSDPTMTTIQTGSEVTSTPKPFIPISSCKTPTSTTKPLEPSKEGEAASSPPTSKPSPSSTLPSSSPTSVSEALKSPVHTVPKIISPATSPFAPNKSIFGQSNASISPTVKPESIVASKPDSTEKPDAKESLPADQAIKVTNEAKYHESAKAESESTVSSSQDAKNFSQTKAPATPTPITTLSSSTQQTTPLVSEAKPTACDLASNESITSSNSPFGQPKLSSTFGQPISSSTTSVFEKPIASTTPSLSGQQTSSASTAVSNSPFGQPSIFGQPSTTPSSASLFGQTTAVTTTSSSFFGKATSAASLFGQTTTASQVFGHTTTSTGSLFGKPTTTSIFGQPTNSTPSVFGQVNTSTSVFGQPVSSSPPSAFGQTPSSTPSVFGQPISSPSAFGQTSTASPSIFGQPAASQTSPVFGQPASSSTTTLFGKPVFQTSPFGQTPTATPFGQGTSSSSSPFGLTSGSVFGQASSPSVFGQPTSSSSSVFGQTSQSFGQNSFFGKTAFNASSFGQPSTFGQPVSTQSSVFGQTSTFGQTGSSAFGQAQPSNMGGLFGGAFSGLGSTGPATPNKNVFGSPSTFGSQVTQQTSLFGSHGAQTFGGKFGGSSFAGGSFSTGAGGSVAQAGFGAVQQQTPPKTGGFGSPPNFGTSPTPAFGSSPTFGGTPPFGSGGIGDNSSSAFGSGASAGFAAYANSSSTSFGALAAQTGGTGTGGFGQASPQPQQQQFGSGFGSSTFGQQSQQPTFGTPTTTGAAFSQWR